MRAKIKKQEEIVTRMRVELDKKREELLAVTKNRKILEKVKEKDWEKFARELARREGMFIDEVGIRGYLRNM